MRLAYAGLIMALLGCDPTRGLADSADAALPSVKRYFDGAGTQLTDGPWNRVVVDLDTDTLYHVGGRRLDDRAPTFHLFGADAREGCAVTPNAGTWLMGKPTQAPFRLLPFLESIDERGRGRLRFTTVDCEVQDVAVEDAGRPYPRLFDHGYLVPSHEGYVFVDPWAGTTRTIAADLQRVLLWSDVIVLWADDQLKSFSSQFEVGSAWGNAPVAVVPLRDAFLAEDADGIHRVTLDHDSLEFTSQDVLSDACHIQTSSFVQTDENGGWIMAEQPCGNPKPSLLHIDMTTLETLDTVQLPFEADARHARALISGPTADGSPAPIATLYLTDVGDDSRGTLWSWRAGGGDPVKLGEQADLDTVSLQLPGSSWDGSAQINYRAQGSYTVYDWIHFRWDGTIETFAPNMVRDEAGEIIVNFDGVAGDLTLFDQEGYRVVAKGVPGFSTEVSSYLGAQHFARIDHFDGESGRVLFGTDPEDPSNWSDIGARVPPESMRFSWFMPAVLFIENWDSDSHTGALVAYNYDLDARTTIAEGVSSFDLTSYPWDGVVYSVPKGKKRGIWFSKAK